MKVKMQGNGGTLELADAALELGGALAVGDQQRKPRRRELEGGAQARGLARERERIFREQPVLRAFALGREHADLDQLDDLGPGQSRGGLELEQHDPLAAHSKCPLGSKRDPARSSSNSCFSRSESTLGTATPSTA